jgi:hypothetical protein
MENPFLGSSDGAKPAWSQSKDRLPSRQAKSKAEANAKAGGASASPANGSYPAYPRPGAAPEGLFGFIQLGFNVPNYLA